MMSVTYPSWRLRPLLAPEIRIKVLALVGQYLPVVESGWQRFEMPFADDRRFVTVLTHQCLQGLLITVENMQVVAQTVGMTEFPGQHRRSTRRTDRVADERAIEAHAFAREAIDVRGLDEFRSVSADRLVSVIVGHDDNDIRPTPGRKTRGCGVLLRACDQRQTQKCNNANFSRQAHFSELIATFED